MSETRRIEPDCRPAMAITRRQAALGLAAFGAAACSGPGGGAGPDAVDAPAPASGWRPGPALPFAVQEIYPTLHAGRIHLAGGFIAAGGEITGPTDRHIAFDPTSGNWSGLTPLPRPRHHPHLIGFAGRLVALAGFEANGPEAVWVMQDGGWSWASGEDDWTPLPTLPRPAGEAVTAVLGGRLHLAGGRRPAGAANAAWSDHTDTGEHFVLDALDGRWQRAAPMPTPRNSAAAAILDGNWHVVGGRTVAGGNTGAHEVYEPGEDRWRPAAPMPQGQGGLAAAALGGRLYAFGGEFFRPQPGGVYAECWAYDPAADAWVGIADMPTPRHGLGAVAWGDQIYVIGGAEAVGGNRTSAVVEIYRP